MKFIPPMECTPVPELPDDTSKWLYEVKLDGYRCCAVVRGGGKASIYSRYGNLWTDRFHSIRNALAAIDIPMILDGEIVALDRDGLPSFQQLQNWQSTRAPIVFYAFDLLQLEDRDLRRLPIEERKRALESVALSDPLRLSATLDAPLNDLVPKMKNLGLEGLIAKRRGSIYQSGERTRSWLKQRFNQVDEFVIGGYLPEGNTFSRLLVGTRDGDRLVFVKKLKNGFSAFTRQQVMEAIRGLRRKTNPFASLPEPMPGAIWLKPERKVEVEFVERTNSGKLRHASFRRLVD
jgi:bifunctional non-homologous end joining protein LigD